MGDAEDQKKGAELISRIFALLTAKCEDAAATAADCQAGLAPDQLRDGAAELEDLLGEAVTLAAVVPALLSYRHSDARDCIR